MRKRFKVPLVIIFILIAICTLVFVSYLLYNNQSYSFNVMSVYPLTINYNTSEIIDENHYENVEFSVINNGEEDVLYTISFLSVISNNDLTYLLTSDVVNASGEFLSGEIADTILIKAGEIQYFNLSIEGVSDKAFSAELYVSKEVNIELNFAQTIISLNDDIKDEPLTSVGTDVATTDEGLIKTNVDDNIIYYFRGDVLNNYVEFGDYTWRIVKINSDNTVKLVLDSEIDVLSKYYDSDTEFYSSLAYETLDEWYQTNLVYYEESLSYSGFCNDNSLVNTENKVYAAYNRVVENSIAMYTCVVNETESYVGLLTIDEVIYAGASASDKNEDFYLINDSITSSFYLMSSAKISGSSYYPFSINTDGSVEYSSVGTTYKALRPVININENEVVTGTGTKEDPFVVS